MVTRADVGAVLVFSPGGAGDAAVCSAAATVGARGVYDIGTGDRSARASCVDLVHLDRSALALRVDHRFSGSVHDWLNGLDANTAAALRQRVDLVVLGPGAPWDVSSLPQGWRALVEVDSAATAWAALAARPAGLIACGSEAGGTQLTCFTLVQKLLADGVGVPVWARGGIGAHTAAAAIAGGAHGVVFTPGDDSSRTLSRSLAEVVRAAGDARSRPFCFGPRSPMARVLGTELPVVQGPMSHVSDEPRFLRAVAEAGGLPFLAMASADADQARGLLERTRADLGDRPWGVGVSAWLDDETRTAQLEVVRECRPRVALIGGGSAAQVATLEDAGIATFLQVSSVCLLGDLIRAGARRFVLEGSECGWNVGQRTGFELWQAMVDALLDVVTGPRPPNDLQVLFSGGIHDERSAAMVSALAEPLARHRVAVGVVMNTAYLFTAEAVQLEAVLPRFQRGVLEAHDTALLDSSPGRAIRCLQSPFVERSRPPRAYLRVPGIDERLRIAAKGVRGSEPEVTTFDEDEQWAEGLYAAGQVAVLRTEVTTIRALHDGVTRGAADFVRRRAVAPAADREPPPLDIAIVGMACVFPGAPDLATFWANTLGNVDCVTALPDERSAPAGRRLPPRRRGVLPPVQIDPHRYGLSPSSPVSEQPEHLLALDVARRALDDAGFGPGDLDRAGLVFGGAGGVGPLAARLGLGGGSCSVDAGAASSLAALDAAARQLTTGAVDLVLCGAADLLGSVQDAGSTARSNAAAPGEGVACLALKRLADAERDGDRVYAVLKGIGSATDGLGAARSGQHRAIERALVHADVPADCIGVLETRSAATASDRTEVATLERVFADAGAEPGSCTLGSATSQLGDTGYASGLAATIRAALAVHYGVRPPARHAQGPDGAASSLSPFCRSSTARPWLQVADERAAGIDSVASGPGGTSYHAVLQGHHGSDWIHSGMSQWPAELFLVRGTHAAAAAPSIDELRRLLADNDAHGRPWRLRDLARTAAGWADRAAAAGVPVQYAVVAADLDELDRLLAAVVAGETAAGIHRRDASAGTGRLAVLSPGRGTEVTDMFAELLVALPQLQTFGRAAAAVTEALHPALFVGGAGAGRSAGSHVHTPEPATGIAGVAVHAMLASVGVEFDMLAGHAEGELVALCVAGAIPPSDLVPLIVARAGASTGSAAGVAAFAAALARTEIRTPELEVWSNRTAAPYPTAAAQVRDEIVEQVRSAVRFVDQLEAMYAAGARTFVEAGPGRTLSPVVSAVLGDRPHTLVPCNGGLVGLLTALARLAVDGRGLLASPLFADRDALDVTGSDAPEPAAWTVDGASVRRSVSPPSRPRTAAGADRASGGRAARAGPARS